MNKATHYVYLVKIPHGGKHMFTLGTTTNPQEQIKKYPKGSHYVVIFCCKDYIYLENILFSKLMTYFKCGVVYEVGDVCFEGDVVYLISDFKTTCLDVNNVCAKYPISYSMTENQYEMKRNYKINYSHHQKVVRAPLSRPQNPVWKRQERSIKIVNRTKLL